MTKKTYCPMTLEHEALEMNQAVAACEYKLVSSAAGADCDSCRTGTHGWLVYDNDGKVETGEKMIIVSAGGTTDTPCGQYPSGVGNAFEYKVQGGEVSGGYVIKILMNLGMLNRGDARHLGMVDGSGNIPGYEGVATASLTQNS